MPTWIYCTSNKLGIRLFLGSAGLTPCAHRDDLLHCWLPKCCWQLAYCKLFVSVTWSQCTCQVINWFKWAYCMTLQYLQVSPEKNEYTAHHLSPSRKRLNKTPNTQTAKRQSQPWTTQSKRHKMRAIDLPQAGEPKARMYHPDQQHAIKFTAHTAQQRNFVSAHPYFQANGYTGALKWFCKPSSL